MSKIKDITGQRFGRLVATHRITDDKWGNVRWTCQCDCGRKHITLGVRLRQGKVSSCGCSRIIDITNQRFGRLVAIRKVKIKSRRIRWHCQCDCGHKHIATGVDLRNGHIASCGCKQGYHVHGYGQHPLYHVWYNMHKRCTDPTHIAFEYYGGRGIKVCKRWNTVANFIADVGKRPRGRSLDRIDTNGDYTPSNWRWATPKQQRNNQNPYKRRSKRLEHFTTAELEAELTRRNAK